MKFRDESFITSWGEGVIFKGGGVGNNFDDVLGHGGVENKMTYGQEGGGGSCISSSMGGGVRCVPLVFLFIKSHNFLGALSPRPPYIPAL